MDISQIIGRSELKYFIVPESIQEIRDYLRPYTELDPFSAEIENHSYTVRSIYFDTDSFDFYYEKMDGLKIRKKIRCRAYNEFDVDKPAFLEIKRRYNNQIIKERAKIPLSRIEEIHKRLENPSDIDTKWVNNKNTVEKYLYNIKKLNLHPAALVTYEREAYIGALNNHERITFDKNIRCLLFPEISELFREDDLKIVTDTLYILELKFENFMPKWMISLVRDLRLRQEPIPKYCMSIDTSFHLPNGQTAQPSVKRIDSYV